MKETKKEIMVWVLYKYYTEFHIRIINTKLDFIMWFRLKNSQGIASVWFSVFLLSGTCVTSVPRSRTLCIGAAIYGD